MKANFLLVIGFFSFLLPAFLSLHYFPWLSFYQDFFAFVGLLFLALSLREVSIGWLPAMFFVCSIIPLLQFFFGVIYFSGDAYFSFFYILAFSVAVVVGEGCRANRDNIFFWFCFALLLGGFFSMWVALSQWLLVDVHWLQVELRGWRVFANFAQPNNFSSYMVCVFLALMYFFLSGRIGVFPFVFCLFFVLICVALAHSRVSLLYLLGFVLFCFLFGRRISISYFWVVFGAAGYLLFYFSLPLLGCQLFLSEACLAGEHLVQVNRLGLWSQLWDALLLQPWQGYGWGQVSVAQSAVSNLHPYPLAVEYSHNIFLDFLLWNGVVGGGLLILLSFYLGFVVLRSVRDLSSFFAAMMLFALAVHSLFEFPLAYAYFLIPFGFLLGLFFSRGFGWLRLPIFAWRVFCAVSAFFMCFVFYEYKVLEERNRLMRYESAGIGVGRELGTGKVYLMTQLAAFIEFARKPAIVGLESHELESMRRVSWRYSYPPAIFRYAYALVLARRYDDAAWELRRLKGLHGDKAFDEALAAMSVLAHENDAVAKFLDGDFL